MKKLYIFLKNKIYLILLIILPVIFFYKIILDPNSMFFPPQDIFSIFSQEKQLFQETVRNYHLLPLWNPYIFSGSPFIGNPTSAMFYPINLLFLFFPVDSVFGFIFMIDTILLGVFTYLFARGIKLDKFSSFIFAITIMFSGSIISLIFPGHLINFDTFIWFPLMLFIYEKTLKKQKISYAILGAFPITLAILAGASQVATFSLLAAFIYLSLRTISNLPKIGKFSYLRRVFTIYFLSIIIGLLLSAIQILPTMEFSKLSARANGLSYDFASDFFLHPKQIISFIFPYFFGNPANGTYWAKGNFWGQNGYIGIIPLILVFMTLIFRTKRSILAFLGLGTFALLYSMGQYTPIFSFFYNYIPGFSSFRTPARFLYYYTFSFAGLAGIGMHLLIQKLSINNKSLSRITSATFLIAIIILPISISGYFNNNVKLYEKYILNNSYAVGINHSVLYFQLAIDLLAFSSILLTFSILLFLIKKNKISIKAFKILLVTLILFDLWNVSSKFLSVKKIAEIYSQPNFIKTIKNDHGNYRIFDKENLYQPFTEKDKIENITGVHSLYIKDYRDFVWAIGKHANTPYESFIQINKIEYLTFLDLLNVKYITDNNKISNNADFLPRAYVVPDAIILPKQKILDKLKNIDFDPRKQIILQKNPGVNLINSSSFKEADVYFKTPNEIKIKVDLDNPGFLILSEVDYPGWKAYDNGKELKIFNADYILRSIYLGKGSHNIFFTYNPSSYKIGKSISIITLFLCLLFLVGRRTFGLVDIKKLFL